MKYYIKKIKSISKDSKCFYILQFYLEIFLIRFNKIIRNFLKFSNWYHYVIIFHIILKKQKIFSKLIFKVIFIS